MKTYDVIIVGAGPCGLATAIEAKKNNLDYLILEKGSIAESIRKYPIHMQFFSTADNISIANIPFAVAGAKATRSEALQYYRKVSEYFDLQIKLFTPVENISKKDNIFEISTKTEETYKAKNVVLAIGYFDFPRQLNIEGEYLPHVKKYYDEPFVYVHRKITIIGGGNSAVEAALDLYRHGAEVTMLLRNKDFKPTAKYWLIPDLKNRVREGNIQVFFESKVQKISKKEVFFEKNNQIQSIKTDAVLLLVGYTSDTKLL